MTFFIWILTVSIVKIYMSHDKYLEILEKNKNHFGDNLGMIKPEQEILE